MVTPLGPRGRRTAALVRRRGGRRGWSSLLVGADGRVWTLAGFGGDVDPDGIDPMTA